MALEVQISWQAKDFVVQISWQVKDFWNVEMQSWWQAQDFVGLEALESR